jgi:hypothetical protein
MASTRSSRSSQNAAQPAIDATTRAVANHFDARVSRAPIDA